VKRFWLVPAMLAGAVLYAGLDRDSGLRTWWQLGRELEASRARAATDAGEIERLEAAARDLDGAFAMEQAIRRDLGLARPGESVVYFTAPEASTPRIP